MQPIENTPVHVEPTLTVTNTTSEVTTTMATTNTIATTQVVTTPTTTSSLPPIPVTSTMPVPDVIPKQPKLFEAPLVVEGKRPRKPSHKLIEKLEDEDVKVEFYGIKPWHNARLYSKY